MEFTVRNLLDTDCVTIRLHHIINDRLADHAWVDDYRFLAFQVPP
jgi:hypothetical protein